MARPILVATRSSGKMKELRALFSGAGHVVLSLDEAGITAASTEDTLEAAATFEDNALSKARYFHARSGLPTIADDSGIEIAALGGAPGVYSKRWSERPDLSGEALDDANNALLIKKLEGVVDRRARYVCAVAFCDGARELVARGEVDGRIAEVPRGSNGFGYDPYFESDELGKTFGEASPAEKARVSHRGRAIAMLLARLE